MRTAPPIVPGMVRRKVRSSPASAARRATCMSSAAAPAWTSPSAISIPLKPRPSRITTPRMPPSRTIRFEPTPIAKTGTSGTRFCRNSIRSSRSAGWNSQSAGPPTRSQVRSARGRSCVSVPRIGGSSVIGSLPFLPPRLGQRPGPGKRPRAAAFRRRQGHSSLLKYPGGPGAGPRSLSGPADRSGGDGRPRSPRWRPGSAKRRPAPRRRR